MREEIGMSDNVDPVYATGGEQAGEAAALALSALPYVGGPLAEVAKGFISRRQNPRLNQFLRDLAADLDELKGRLNAKLGESADFEDFAERVVSAAEQTVQEEKLDALRAVFLNTILSSPPRYDPALEVVDLVLQLQPRHLVVLKILEDPAPRRPGSRAGLWGRAVVSARA